MMRCLATLRTIGCVLFVLLFAACALSPPPVAPPATVTPPAPIATPVSPTTTPHPFAGLAEWDVVVIGDSTLWGVAEPYAQFIEQDRRVKVNLHAEWQGGLSAGTILRALLFQHLLRPKASLAEMIRVTRPGGWVVLADTDWGTLSIDTSEIVVERRLARIKAETHLNNGYAGRQLHRLFVRAGLTDIAVEMAPSYVTRYAVARQVASLDEVERLALASGAVTADALDRWHADLERADEEGVFFASVSLVLAAGRRVENRATINPTN